MPAKKKVTKGQTKKKGATRKVVKKTKKKVEKVSKKKVVKKQTKTKVVTKVSAKKVSTDKSKSEKKIHTPQLLRGMKDILPNHEVYWKKMYETALSLTNAYNFAYIETPVLESASLFVRSIGGSTDIIEKEMYVFEDRDGSKVAMRPEATASIVRSYIGHGMHVDPQPVKVWYYGPMFRHDRPQAGRFREFHQFGCETLGVRDAVVDAELIVVAYNFLRDLGIDTNVHINSIGSPQDRQNYKIELVAYLRSKRSYLCDDCKRRINKNPLRTLDCKSEQCQPVKEDAPQIIDWLKEDAKEYFMKVLEYLDELDIPYVLQPTLVRGLDYYTDTVFEMYQIDEEGASQQSALCGGGRYDLLSEQLGGQPTPASGFAMGLERVVSALRKKAGEGGMKDSNKAPIYFAQLGWQGRQKALALLEDMRRNNIFVYHNLGKSSLKAQLEAANKFGVTHSIILGQKEVQDGTVIIRDMESGIQEIVDQKKLKREMDKILQKKEM